MIQLEDETWLGNPEEELDTRSSPALLPGISLGAGRAK